MKEIRAALMGRLAAAEDGRLAVPAPGAFGGFHFGDGADAVLLLGIARRTRTYETKDSRAAVLAAAKKAMANSGRGLALRSQPECAACLCRSLLTHPVVLAFAIEDGKPALRAYTARSPTCRLALRRAIGRFEKSLPEGMTPAEVRRDKEAEREAKQAAKREKKAEKKKRDNKGKQTKETERPAEDDGAGRGDTT